MNEIDQPSSRVAPTNERCACWACRPDLMKAEYDRLGLEMPEDPYGLKARIKLLEAQKAALLELWEIEASVVRLEPGNVLLIGGVDYNHGIEAAERLGDFREATGASAVWLFTGDIDVESVRVAEREHCQALKRQRDEERVKAAELERWRKAVLDLLDRLSKYDHESAFDLADQIRDLPLEEC